VLYGSCSEDLAVPYRPWITALGQLVEHADPQLLTALSPVEAGALARLLPMHADRLPSGDVVAGDGDTGRLVLMEAVSPGSSIDLTTPNGTTGTRSPSTSGWQPPTGSRAPSSTSRICLSRATLMRCARWPRKRCHTRRFTGTPRWQRGPKRCAHIRRHRQAETVGTTVAVTIVFTDLVGSTAIGSSVSPADAEDLRPTYFGILRDAITTTSTSSRRLCALTGATLTSRTGQRGGEQSDDNPRAHPGEIDTVPGASPLRPTEEPKRPLPTDDPHPG